ncbi:MAG: acyltransferase [Cyclobacteriaceae bacterium]|nr:acyltransferase [Cyclobacteriaceae bacterium]
MRIKVLDFLRGGAVLLVLFRHYGFVDSLQRIGWIGVDLFFVLSGFLVSGLLYREYVQTNEIDVKRFLIRRGLKIYPLFYFAIILTVAANEIFAVYDYNKYHFNSNQVLVEALFMQNYFKGLWSHTWSLAVEEHFYLLLALLFVVLNKLKKLDSHLIINCIFILIAFSSFAFRVKSVLTGADSYFGTLFQTHMRIDSLFFGVWLSYQYHFNRNRFVSFFRRYSNVLICISGACLLPLFIFEINDPFTLTIQLTLLYLGFGCLLGLSLVLSTRGNLFVIPASLYNLVASMGVYSYSIYLFHLFVPKYLIPVVLKLSPVDIPRFGMFFLYFGTAISLGILFSKVIELPVLRFRDRFFSASKVNS